MKKFLILISFFHLALLCSTAQVTWNIKGGVGLASCITGANVNPKAYFVAKIGAGLEKPLTPNLMLLPSLEFALKGGKYELKNYDGNESLSLVYVQLPVLIGYRFNLSDMWNMTVKAGPYFAYALSGKLKQDFVYEGITYNHSLDIFSNNEMKQTAKRFDVGIDAGIDFEVKRFVLGLEYELGFISMAPNDAKLKNQAAYITVGYKF